jgi:hypothetical protein
MKEKITSLKQSVSQYIRNDQSDEPSFNELALQLFAFQFQYNPPYQQFCKMRKRTPMTVRHWTQIPAVPISAFKEASLTTVPYEEAEATFMTSGTTRPNQKGKNAHLDLEIYDLSMQMQFKNYMLPDREKMLMFSLFPEERTLPHSSLAHYLTLALKRFGAEGSQCVYQGETFEAERLISLLRNAEQAEKPVFLLGATFSFIHFFDYCADRAVSFHLAVGSRLMDTGGTKNHSRSLSSGLFRQEMSQLFSLPIEHIGNMYGMTELSSQFYDTSIHQSFAQNRVPADPLSPSYKTPPNWVRTRVVNPESMQEVAIGDRGIIIHYDLANLYSVSAMMTEDVGIRLENGFVLLGRAEGAEARGCSLAVEEFIRATESKGGM